MSSVIIAPKYCAWKQNSHMFCVISGAESVSLFGLGTDLLPMPLHISMNDWFCPLINAQAGDITDVIIANITKKCVMRRLQSIGFACDSD
jgi:hypothetical protein